MKRLGEIIKLQVPEIELSDNPEKDLLEVYEPASNFIYFFRNDYKLMLDLLESANKSQQDDLVEIVCHFFYEDIITHNHNGEEIIRLCYFLLEKEISNLSSPNPLGFLVDSVLAKMIRSLAKRNEFKNFINNSISNIINKLDKTEDQYFDITTNKLVLDIKKNENNDFSKKSFISRQNTIIERVRKFTTASRISNAKYETNSLKQETLSKFDLGKMSDNLEQEKEHNLHEDTNKYFDTFKEFDDTEIEENASDLSEDNLIKMYGSTNDEVMKSLCKNNLKILNNLVFKLIRKTNEDKDMFSNIKFTKSLSKQENEEQILENYISNFESLKFYCDLILKSIFENVTTIPYTIKCLCKMVTILMPKKVHIYFNISTYFKSFQMFQN